MSRNQGVLIVSASAGSGHVRAAEALREALVEQCGPGRVEHVDVLALAPTWVQRVYGGGFELVASRAPSIWRELYERTDGEAPDRARWGPLAHRLLFRAFRRLATSGRWRRIVCTHFLPAQLAPRQTGFPPLDLVVTDFTLHRYWAQPLVRRFFCATEALAAQLRLRTGAAAMATGIPVASGFAVAREITRGSPAWQEQRVLSGFDPTRPLALVMGGGMGMGLDDVAQSALWSGVPRLQTAIVCGRNDAARERLSARWSGDGVRVLGHVRSIPHLMAAADVVITKPGGLTSSEALAVGRPLLLTRPMPGHEAGNLRELVRLGAALPTVDPEALTETMRRLFASPGLLEAMGDAARAAGNPDAATRVARLVAAETLQDAA